MRKKVSVIAVDEQELRLPVSEVVRQSVEETLNGLLHGSTSIVVVMALALGNLYIAVVQNGIDKAV